MLRILKYVCAVVAPVLVAPAPTSAQVPTMSHEAHSPAASPSAQTEAYEDALTQLVAEALERNPRLAASRAQSEAAQAAVSRAGTWEDPVLSMGFVNLRTTSFDFADDFMTMKMVQLAQRIPLPGQIGHRREAAALRAASAEHTVEAARVEVATEVKRAYAEIYYRDRALAIVDRNLNVLRGLEDVTRTRYATGVGRQPAVLRAGLETDGLEVQRVNLAASRHAAVARLNALRDRPASTPVDETPYPTRLLALTGRRGPDLAFIAALDLPSAGTDLGARPGVPPLDYLIALAIENKPELRAHVARIAAQEETVELARALRWPAPQLSIGYGQREGFPDMVNASISFRLPIFLGAKQEAAVREESAVLARERATHDRMVSEIERDVTVAYSRVLDALGQLDRYDLGILQRSEATLNATLVAYQSGAEDFLALLDSQTRLYRFELERHRLLADLLGAWADLERSVGREIEP